ncbi:MAG: cupredoxin family copper-binding protein [Candidatus Paceibacterota bacterium]|jgi:plastocyanin
MNKNIFIGLIVILIIVGGGYYALKGTVTTTPTVKSTTPESNLAPVVNKVTNNVSISNFAFVPPTITVKKGEEIVWTNKDTMSHTVTGGDLKSSPLGQNQTYSFNFTKAGTYSYRCSIHPSMTGTVVVTN